jgi:tRNA modification GTPase
MLAALLTPPGRGAIAVIHVAGEGAKELVAGLFRKEITDRPRAGKLVHREEIVDEVMVRTAPGFTGEETVEITCHGGTATVDRIFAALGVPRVDDAELLERGVETGHLDRIRAEAWALLPRALTELAARVLHDQAEGALSRAVRDMGAPRDAERLLATAPLGLALASPRKVVLAGSPNVGKSTLFNALVAADRALVSPEPGTTRDPVRERVAIDQVPIELIDTAGVEEPRDLLEQLSIDRTRKMLGEADVILFLFDAEAGARGDELRFLEVMTGRRVILLVNKVDTGKKKPLLEALPISAKTGQGLDEVRRRILHALKVRPEYREGAPVVFTERQQRLLGDAARGQSPLEEVRQALLETPARPPVR